MRLTHGKPGTEQPITSESKGTLLQRIRLLFRIRERHSGMRGTLTRFNQNSGMGTITSEQGVDLQVHKTSLDPSRWTLQQGQTVEFRIYYGPNGPIAENVHRLRN